VHPRSDAVFIANDTMTLGAMQALREAGATVPDDVAVIGFDETPWSAELYAPLTTVVQPTREMGQEAMRLMLRRLDDPDAPSVTTTLHTRLCIRVSCGVDRASAVAADRLTG
jgi:LacI family transcriptional regulator